MSPLCHVFEHAPDTLGHLDKYVSLFLLSAVRLPFSDTVEGSQSGY